MQCPKCESDDVLTCPVAYDQGRSVIQTKGRSEGGDSRGLVTADYESTHTALTDFAKRAAAPTPKINEAVGMFIAAIAAYFIVPSAWHDLAGHIPRWLSFLLLAVVIAALYHLVNAYKHRSEDHARHAAWERSWICKRCGTIFDPSERVPGVRPAE